ncbi:uncharacterized protein LOC119522394 [Choloepus didactylus]|uniref:uncharacterized protein LOC119522394 n=1 Tax=Choloepus didactylus TaxID=27675 RepID=UPI0018A06F1D|nr:uncharacterized protein LOC119522394 [Choloepus didactylus]
MTRETAMVLRSQDEDCRGACDEAKASRSSQHGRREPPGRLRYTDLLQLVREVHVGHGHAQSLQQHGEDEDEHADLARRPPGKKSTAVWLTWVIAVAGNLTDCWICHLTSCCLSPLCQVQMATQGADFLSLTFILTSGSVCDKDNAQPLVVHPSSPHPWATCWDATTPDIWKLMCQYVSILQPQWQTLGLTEWPDHTLNVKPETRSSSCLSEWKLCKQELGQNKSIFPDQQKWREFSTSKTLLNNSEGYTLDG